MLAPTPPMGWNSWDCYGTTVTETEVLANARFMAERMSHLGWDTVVVDICWYDPSPHAHGYTDGSATILDDFGRAQPAPNRFPSSAGGAGFAPLAETLHAWGLKLGLHVLRGIPRRAVELDLPVHGTSWTAAEVADRASTCPWNSDNFGLNHDHPGGQAYYDSQVAQFASWGVDFVKADDMLAPYHEREITAYARAVRASGRPMVLSLSPGDRLSTAHLDHLRDNAQMWRVSADLWDRWSDVHAQFARMARWAPFQRPGAWADADMLPLGRIGIRAEQGVDRQSLLSAEEQRTLLTLWVMSRSPLMMGGDLPSSETATIEAITNPRVLGLLSSSRDNRELLREPVDGGELIVWGAGRTDAAGCYVAVFWTGESARTFAIPLASLDIRDDGDGFDCWTGEPVPVTAVDLVVTIAGHGCRLLRFGPT